MTATALGKKEQVSQR